MAKTTGGENLGQPDYTKTRQKWIDFNAKLVHEESASFSEKRFVTGAAIITLSIILRLYPGSELALVEILIKIFGAAMFAYGLFNVITCWRITRLTYFKDQLIGYFDMAKLPLLTVVMTLLGFIGYLIL